MLRAFLAVLGLIVFAGFLFTGYEVSRLNNWYQDEKETLRFGGGPCFDSDALRVTVGTKSGMAGIAHRECIDVGEPLEFNQHWRLSSTSEFVAVSGVNATQVIIALRDDVGVTRLEAWSWEPLPGALQVAGDLGTEPSRLQVSVVGGGAYQAPELRGVPEFERVALEPHLASNEELLCLQADIRADWIIALVRVDEGPARVELRALDSRAKAWSVLASGDMDSTLADCLYIDHVVHEQLGECFVATPISGGWRARWHIVPVLEDGTPGDAYSMTRVQVSDAFGRSLRIPRKLDPRCVNLAPPRVASVEYADGSQ